MGSPNRVRAIEDVDYLVVGSNNRLDNWTHRRWQRRVGLGIPPELMNESTSARSKGLKRDEDGRSEPTDLTAVWVVVVGWKEIGCNLEDRGRVKKA